MVDFRYWHKADIELSPAMSAFGGKADIVASGRHVCFKADIEQPDLLWRTTKLLTTKRCGRVSLIHRFQPADVFPNHSQMNFQALKINLEWAGNL